MNLLVLNKTYAIYKFDSKSDLPGWIFSSDFYSVTKTADELSVVTVQNDSSPDSISCNKDWRIIKVIGPLDFTLVGLITEISAILSKERIPIFTISTYDTDYFLVKQTDLDGAVSALQRNKYSISNQG